MAIPSLAIRLFTHAMLLACILAPILAHAEFVRKVVGVIDGDSLRVMHEGKAEQIRLIGVDCPEKRQPFGTRAKEFTSELTFGQDVTVYGEKRDRYGRRLAEVLLPDGRSPQPGTHQGGPRLVVSEVFEGSAARGVGTAGTEDQAGAMDGSTFGAALRVAGSSSTTLTCGSHPLELYSVL